MANFKLFFEVNGIGADADGNPCTVCLAVDFGAEIDSMDYWTVANGVDLEAVANKLLFGVVPASEIRVISPEDAAKYE